MTKTLSRNPLISTIGENIVPNALWSKTKARLSSGERITISTYWSLNRTTVLMDPRTRYHIGHLLFLHLLAAFHPFNAQLRIYLCDTYELDDDTDPKMRWREGRIKSRAFLERLFLLWGDRANVYYLRDPFDDSTPQFNDAVRIAELLLSQARQVAADASFKGISNDQLDTFRSYRGPSRPLVLQQFGKKLTKTNPAFARLGTRELAALLYTLKRRHAEWLRSKWTSRFIAHLTVGRNPSAGDENIILEGERNRYSWDFHGVFASLVAAQVKRDSLRPPLLSLMCVRNVPDLSGAKFMALSEAANALFWNEVEVAQPLTHKYNQFHSNCRDTVARLKSLIELRTSEQFLPGAVHDVAAKLCDYRSKRTILLHASDLHLGRMHSFGTATPDMRWGAPQQIVNHVARGHPFDKPDLLVVSGDLTSVCSNSEFQAAGELLRRAITSRALRPLAGNSISPHQILVVPGNHDFAWDKSSALDQADPFVAFAHKFRFVTPWTNSSNVCRIVKPSRAEVPVRIAYYRQLETAIVLVCSTLGSRIHERDKAEYARLRRWKRQLDERTWLRVRSMFNADNPSFPGDYVAAIAECLEKLAGEVAGPRPNIICVSHHNVRAVGDAARSIPQGTHEVEKLLIDCGAALWLHGHLHVSYHDPLHDPAIWGAATLGGWAAEGHSVNIVTMYGGGARYQVQQLQYALDGDARTRNLWG